MLPRIPTLAGLWLVAACTPLVAAQLPSSRPSAAVLPLQNQAGHLSAGKALHQGVERELELRFNLVRTEHVRNVMRSLRIRSSADLSADRLRLARSALQVDWLISITLHDIDRRQIPAMTASAQILRADNGELFWSGLVGRSGLSGLPWLGLGVTHRATDLAREVAQQLADAIEKAIGSTTSANAIDLEGVEKWALVPLSGLTPKNGTANAATITEVVRDVGQELGLQLVSPNIISGILRSQETILWGGATRELREALVTECDAGAILTGTVEIYEVTGSELEPEPRVGISLRLVDAATGNILWTGASERSGFHKKGPFGAGRIHSRGELARQLTKKLLVELQRSKSF